ncbi:hypothetical protein YQE_01804, partial [Dendroctonus ponderosae]
MEITVWCSALLMLISTFCQCATSREPHHPYRSTYENSTLKRVRRQSACKGDFSKFQCETNPECIDSDKQCDGKDDCPDGSDEKQSLCQSIVCPGFLFQCEYGACISFDQRCDGKKDCKDNSDEIGCPPLFQKINTNCRSDQFECTNGQCIEIDGRCNGAIECKDKSDETETLCLNTECPGYTFKCKYGACVNGDAECNGYRECADGSDEDKCTQTPPTTTETPVTTNISGAHCITPPQPENGKWINFLNEGVQEVPNIQVPLKTTLKFTCNDKYKLSTTTKSEEFVYCRNDAQWSFTVFPKCQRLCPKMYNGNNAIISCKLDGSIVPCEMATFGTTMTFTCNPYYEPAIIGLNTINTCGDGAWYYDNPKCQPICGQKQVEAQTLVVGGAPVKRGQYPWVAALFSNRESGSYTNICGGSLLSTSIVLTAAHCVTYQATGKPINKKFFKVAAGKYYNAYGDVKDMDTTQVSAVKQIVVQDDYLGDIQNFRGDIALIKLVTSFALSKVVQPVCTFSNEQLLTSNSVAAVAGWGYTTSSGKPSTVLQEIDLPYVSNEQCRTELSPDFAQKYLLSDKLCAGYVNKNMSVCRGDSGGGLVFRASNNRYYLLGIVSLAHSFLQNNQQSCDIQKRALFTDVSKYKEWVLKYAQILSQ